MNRHLYQPLFCFGLLLGLCACSSHDKTAGDSNCAPDCEPVALMKKVPVGEGSSAAKITLQPKEQTNLRQTLRRLSPGQHLDANVTNDQLVFSEHSSSHASAAIGEAVLSSGGSGKLTVRSEVFASPEAQRVLDSRKTGN